jgi:uncharacterized protein
VETETSAPPRVKHITWALAIVIVLIAWALLLDGQFVRTRARIEPSRADELANRHGAVWKDVSVRAQDEVTLRGWHFTPKNSSNRAVLLVHGRGGTRQHMLKRAESLLSAGYHCLLIDQRGSGASEGLFSYGVHESNDIRIWTAWLRGETRVAHVFAHGVSRGSTTLIRSLAAKPALDAVAVESVGVGNSSRPYKFVADWAGVPEQTARLLSWPFIEPSFAWIKFRHGLDLRSAPSGIEAIQSSHVPVLIVQGAEDQGTPLKGAEQLRDANPGRVELVVIPNGGHDLFPTGLHRVLAWFDRQAAKP